MTKDDFLDYARAADKDMVQITTLLEVAPDVSVDRLMYRTTQDHQWFAKPELNMSNGFVDLRGNVWRFPFEQHEPFARMLDFPNADDLREVGWLHVSNFDEDPNRIDGDCHGKPMTRAQQRTVDKLWPETFRFDDANWRPPLPSPALKDRERIAQIEATYGKVRRALAKEGYTQ